jgi:hypothetical protein
MSKAFFAESIRKLRRAEQNWPAAFRCYLSLRRLVISEVDPLVEYIILQADTETRKQRLVEVRSRIVPGVQNVPLLSLEDLAVLLDEWREFVFSLLATTLITCAQYQSPPLSMNLCICQCACP